MDRERVSDRGISLDYSATLISVVLRLDQSLKCFGCRLQYNFVVDIELIGVHATVQEINFFLIL